MRVGEGLGGRTIGVQAPEDTLSNGTCATTERVPFSMFIEEH